MPVNYNSIRTAFNRIKHLYGKDTPKEVIWAKAKEVAAKHDINIITKFSNKDEQKLAKELVAKYLDDYTIDTVSEKNTLKEIIYLEVVQDRLQEKLNEFHSTNKALPINLIEIIHKNSDAIIKLKTTLGLNKSTQKAESSYDVITHLKKRFEKYREENQASRTLICPHCMKMVMLKIRTEGWEAQGHPFFKDRILYNKKVMELYRKGVITKQDVADILECSVDYAEWVINKIENPHPASASTDVEVHKTEVGNNSSSQDEKPNSLPAE